MSLPDVGCRMSMYNIIVRMTRYAFKVKKGSWETMVVTWASL